MLIRLIKATALFIEAVVQYCCVIYLFSYIYNADNIVSSFLVPLLVVTLFYLFCLWKGFNYLRINTYITLILALVCYSMIKIQSYQFYHPERPVGVPSSAIWLGGDKGGEWLESVSSNEDTVRIRVYSDCNPSELRCDSIFVFPDKSVSVENWQDYGPCFDGRTMTFSSKTDQVE